MQSEIVPFKDPSELNKTIGIVGGGISGLACAYYLMQKGYKKIILFEAADRVGGKCYTVKYRNKSYEMGSIMGLPSYKRIKGLMKTFKVKHSGTQLSRGFFSPSGKLVSQLSAEERPLFMEQVRRLPEILKDYSCLLEGDFSNYPRELGISFKQWCERKDLEVVSKVYSHCFTTFGFGDIENVPAAYVLKIISLENFKAFVEISHVETWAEGVSELLYAMADQVPDLRLSQKVTGIRLKKQDGTSRTQKKTSEKVLIQSESGEFQVDEVIYTGAYEYLKNLLQGDEVPQAPILHENFHVYAFEVDGVPESCGYVIDHLRPENRGHLTIWYDRWPRALKTGLITVYAYEKEGLSLQSQIELIEQDLKNLGCKQVRLYLHKGWTHFPHVDSSVFQSGFFRQVNEAQGRGGLYIAGELLSGSNLENCVAYAEWLTQSYF